MAQCQNMCNFTREKESKTKIQSSPLELKNNILNNIFTSRLNGQQDGRRAVDQEIAL